MPEPPAESLSDRGRVEDFGGPHQRVRDEVKKHGQKHKHDRDDDPNKIYGWRHYYEAPKLKDFEPGSSLSNRMSSAPPPPARRFRDASPGYVILTLVREAHARGAIPEIRCNFNGDKDSDGRKWPKRAEDRVNHKFEPGTTILQVVRWLEENDYAEATMRGRVLQLRRPGGQVRKDVILAKGRNLVDGPKSGSVRELATAAYVLSESGVHVWAYDKAARKRWGRIEVFHTVSAARQWEVVSKAGHRLLDRLKDPRHAYTYGVVPDRGANPYKDYDNGDRVYVLENGHPVLHRVRQIGLTWEEGQLKIALTLSHKLLSQTARIDRKMRALQGKNHSTTTVRPSGSPDLVAPNAPSPPQVSSRAGSTILTYDGYDAEGVLPVWDQRLVELHIGAEQDFQPTDATMFHTFATAGSVPVPIPDYETTYYAKFIAVDEGGDRSEPSEEIAFSQQQVQASDISPGAVGPEELSPDIEVPAPDGLPPPPVSDLVAVGGKGILSVRWGGVVNPDATPVRYELHMAEADFVPVFGDSNTLLIDTNGNIAAAISQLPNGGGLVYFEPDPITGEPTDEPKLYWFSVIAYDGDGPAAPSPTVSAAMNQLVAVDLAVRSITGELFAGEIVLASVIGTPALTGARIQLGVKSGAPPSLVAYDAAEQITALITTDGTPHAFRGEATLDAATISKMSLSGTEHVMLPGSRVTLRGTTLAPTGQPTATGDTWPTQTLDEDPFNALKRGMWFDPAGDGGAGSYFFCVQGFGPNPVSAIEEVNRNGVHLNGWQLRSATGALWQDVYAVGIVKVGTDFYVLVNWVNNGDPMFHPNGVWDVIKWPAASQFGNVSPHTDLWNINSSGAINWRPALGYDSANNRLMIAYAGSGTGAWRVDQRTLTGGTAPGVVVGPDNGKVALSAVMRGTFDTFTDESFVIAPENSGGGQPNVRVMNAATGADQPNRYFPIANGAHLAGMCHDGTNFYHVSINDALGHIVEYTLNAWTTSDPKWWSCYTLWDGTHETGPSAKRNITMTKRGRLTLTAPPIPSGSTATRIRWYVGRGAGAPADANMFRQSDPAVGVVTSKYDDVDFAAAATLATARTPFEAGAASDYMDEAGQTLLKSDGSIGSLTTGDLKIATYTVPGGGAVIDNGWVLLDGTDVSTGGVYNRLWIKWGSPAPAGGAPAGTFRLVNTKGRMPIGAGTFLGVRETTGPADSDPTHTHTISSGGGHAHGGSGDANLQRASGAQAGLAGVAHTHPSAGDHNHGGNTGTSGAGAIPAFGVNWLVKL